MTITPDFSWQLLPKRDLEKLRSYPRSLSTTPWSLLPPPSAAASIPPSLVMPQPQIDSQCPAASARRKRRRFIRIISHPITIPSRSCPGQRVLNKQQLFRQLESDRGTNSSPAALPPLGPDSQRSVGSPLRRHDSRRVCASSYGCRSCFANPLCVLCCPHKQRKHHTCFRLRALCCRQ